jgi:hypothetical protein
MDSCNSAIDVKEGTNMCSYKSLQLFYKLAQQLVISSSSLNKVDQLCILSFMCLTSLRKYVRLVNLIYGKQKSLNCIYGLFFTILKRIKRSRSIPACTPFTYACKTCPCDWALNTDCALGRFC